MTADRTASNQERDPCRPVADLGDMVPADGMVREVTEVFVLTKASPRAFPPTAFRPIVGLPGGVLTYREAVAVEIPECMVCEAPGAADCIGMIGGGYVLRNWRCSRGCCRVLRGTADDA